MRIFVDYHHSSLLRSHVITFEEMLGHEVYRPVGMDWFHQGFWMINQEEATAHQFLDPLAGPNPDKTPMLNVPAGLSPSGVIRFLDPGGDSHHNAITLEAFKDTKFDIIMPSIPQHIIPFRRLMKLYQPQAKLVLQVGNHWNLDIFRGLNILASVLPRDVPSDVNAHFYHQAFDTDIFRYRHIDFLKQPRVSTFVNCIHEKPQAFGDFLLFKKAGREHDFSVASYGGQCPDGNMNGPFELASAIADADFVLHSKDGGDGYGHIIHNVFACGRPIIIRRSQYAGQLAERLFQTKSCINLEDFSGIDEVITAMHHMNMDEACDAAYAAFQSEVDFESEAPAIERWLIGLQG